MGCGSATACTKNLMSHLLDRTRQAKPHHSEIELPSLAPWHPHDDLSWFEFDQGHVRGHVVENGDHRHVDFSVFDGAFDQVRWDTGSFVQLDYGVDEGYFVTEVGIRRLLDHGK